MKKIILSQASAIWVALVSATAVSWWIGAEDSQGAHGATLQRLSVALLVVAFFKVRLVIMHFMEVRHAPMVLRGILEGWVFAVCALLVGLNLWGSNL